MTTEQTPAGHAYQRDLVARSELLQASRADRRDMPRRKPVVVVVPVAPHVFVVPVVTENGVML